MPPKATKTYFPASRDNSPECPGPPGYQAWGGVGARGKGQAYLDGLLGGDPAVLLSVFSER